MTVLKIGKRSDAMKKILWLISVSRNVIVVIVTTVISSLWGNPPYKVVGTVHGGMPTVQPPQFLLPPRGSNETMNGTAEAEELLSFEETWEVLKAGPVVIALISVLQNVAISKTFGAGQSVDATQEMFALGKKG